MRHASIRRLIFLALLCYIAPWSGLLYARCDYQGVIQAIGIQSCLEGETHAITDPCTGVTTFLKSTTYNLSDYICQSVAISGPGVGMVECLGCEITEVQSLQPRPLSCVLDVKNLTVEGPPDQTWLRWSGLPCTSGYDIIKGDLVGFSVSGSVVDLGRVSCFEKDHQVANTFNGPHDTKLPVAGRAFFYLVRAKGPLGVTPYGLSSWGAEETVSGGCHL